MCLIVIYVFAIRYHDYRQYWLTFKVPGEDNRDSLRWNLRVSLAFLVWHNGHRSHSHELVFRSNFYVQILSLTLYILNHSELVENVFMYLCYFIVCSALDVCHPQAAIFLPQKRSAKLYVGRPDTTWQHHIRIK